MVNRRPLKPCKHWGCSNVSQSTYCELHKKNFQEIKASRNRHYDKYKRNKKHDEFYHSKTWAKCRDYIKARDMGLCQHCLADKQVKPGVIVDHIIPLSEDWNKRFDESNLQLLCVSCHNIKTNEDKKIFSR